VTHRTGIPIAALDINKNKTHAILAGKDILKTVRIQDGRITEDFNLRSSITSYASARTSPQADITDRRREYLPARDVKWSIGHWEHIVATAATNGRIALYDLNAPSAKTEWAWLHEHSGQINKLDIDPHAGYLLLSASQDKSVRLWDLREPRPDRSRNRFEIRSAVRDVSWCPVETFDFAVCADGGVVQKWDVRNSSLPKLSINAHDKACYSIDYHPDGRHVISGGFDKYIRIWDFESDKKRQKPVFQLKAPHAIKNIKWRPACSISESEESSVWQSTQVAVSYYHDDPRIHVFDLRRPLLPFRELDGYSTTANDLLWAEKDLLWAVGDDGIFTQWDLKHIPPCYNQLPPCTSIFSPGGQYDIFTEDRELRRASSHEEPAVGFLSVPYEKLSGGDDGLASRSLTDDEATAEHAEAPSYRRRDVIPFSSKSNKSQTNSPPSVEEKPPILRLDQAVLTRPDLFNNDQYGATGDILDVVPEREIVSYLAVNYAIPATSEESRVSPDTILEQLERAFNQNAHACDDVAMHRTAQTWRMLAAVVVPELKDWADTNRARRRAEAARRREELENFQRGVHRPGLSPLAGLANRGNGSRHDGRGHKLISNLFKSLADGGSTSGGRDGDSNSSMTTPLAKPLPNSPPSDDKRWSQMSIEEGLDTLPPLPPSVLTSHSTAAAAARALMESPDRAAKSDTSSSGKRRSSFNAHGTAAPTKSPVSPVKKPLEGQRRTSSQNKTQEDRRAALRDYRAQARPIFSLGNPAPIETSGDGHDSAESFPMFSVSTDSSQKARSVEQSFDSPHVEGRASLRRQVSDTSSDNFDDFDASYSPQAAGNLAAPQRDKGTTDQIQGQAIENSFEKSFGPRQQGATSPQHNEVWKLQKLEPTIPGHMNTAVSTSPDIFHFEGGDTATKPRIHTSNPIRFLREESKHGETAYTDFNALSNRLSLDELDCKTYLAHDFRPIDLSGYEPKQPFAWSALPLICQCIASDLDNGIGQGQFSAHLLTHVHQYFFHPSFRGLEQGDRPAGDTLADRLMTPQIGHRIIGGIFESYLSLLRQMRQFETAALVKKMCAEFEYLNLNASATGARSLGHSLTNREPHLLSVACNTCQAPMAAGTNVCERCRRLRPTCPICQSLNHDVRIGSDQDSYASLPGWGLKNGLWMCCPACGHAGHVRCLTEWFEQPFSEGACPTAGCGCDCGPGKTREDRIQRQVQREGEAKLIRGSSPSNGAGNSTKRDPLRATPSPAVDKTRAALRNSFAGERTTQSGDERSLPSRRGSSRGRASGISTSRKSVRLVTPGEEDATTQSRTRKQT
jgi:WD40 repeat protein